MSFCLVSSSIPNGNDGCEITLWVPVCETFLSIF
jgi:hypothetical protein